MATSQDIRVLIIKLVDRLHNMETLEHIPEEKQLRIAQETLEIYVPVAHRLGMGKLRKELEDLAFPYVYPDESKQVTDLLFKKFGNATELLETERKVLQKRLAKVGLLEFQTSFRVKGMYSLFHKLQRKDWNIESIYDLLAMRVVVTSVEDCYRTLGIIHELWRPLPKRVKDYIAFPKPKPLPITSHNCHDPKRYYFRNSNQNRRNAPRSRVWRSFTRILQTAIYF